MRPLPPNGAYDPGLVKSESSPAWTVLFWVALAAMVAMASWLVMRLDGLSSLMLVTAILSFGTIFAAVSFRYLVVPMLVWLLSLLGFRGLFMLHTPGLPDLSPDRVLLVWVMSAFLFKLALGDRPRARWQLLDTLLIVHLLYLLTSIIIHDNTGFNSWTRAYLMGYAAYFVAKYIIDGRWALIRTIALLLLLLNIYYGVVAIAEHFKINALVWPKMILDPANRGWVGRSHGVFLQPAVYGIIMGMFLPIQIYFLRSARNPLLRVLLYASIPLVMTGLYFTYTRGSWLVGLFGLLTIGLVGWRRYMPLVSRMVLVGLLLMAFGLINIKEDRWFVQRMATEHTVTGRIGTLVRAYRIFLDHPVFGCGYFRYNFVKRDYQGTIDVPIFGTIRRSEDIGASIHDMYLGSLSEEGLVGASLHLAIYLQIFFLFRRRYLLRHSGDPFAINLMPAMAGLMVGYLIGGLSIDYRFFESLLAPFFLMVGLIAGYRPTDEAPPAGDLDPPLRLFGKTDLSRAG